MLFEQLPNFFYYCTERNIDDVIVFFKIAYSLFHALHLLEDFRAAKMALLPVYMSVAHLSNSNSNLMIAILVSCFKFITRSKTSTVDYLDRICSLWFVPHPMTMNNK